MHPVEGVSEVDTDGVASSPGGLLAGSFLGTVVWSFTWFDCGTKGTFCPVEGVSEVATDGIEIFRGGSLTDSTLVTVGCSVA